ncbi:MAG: hypothetical protein VZS44_02625 [Bacilli bacterium]|nr:hypothetical protein [Bacilli bacterium]
MKDKLIEKISLIITILIVLLFVYLGYRVFTRVNVKRTIKNDINEILKDYEINKYTKEFKIVIHSKSNYSTKISYNIIIKNDKYDKLEFEIQKEIIKYIKNISFKGNNKKYFINKVTINSNNNKYEYKTLFKKNGKIYGVGGIGTDDNNNTTDNIKEKWEEIKEKFKN